MDGSLFPGQDVIQSLEVFFIIYFLVGIRAGNYIFFPRLVSISATKIWALQAGKQSLVATSSQVSQFLFS